MAQAVRVEPLNANRYADGSHMLLQPAIGHWFSVGVQP
jgi:hypothetical protein